MLITNSNSSFAMKNFSVAGKAETSSSPSLPTDSFTFSSTSDKTRSFKELAGIALAGAAGGAIGSLAPGYWSVPANLASGAVTGAGGAALDMAISKDNHNGYGGLLIMGSGLWGGASGIAAGVGTNLLELTGLPRLAAGAISGSIANVAMFSFLSNR